MVFFFLVWRRCLGMGGWVVRERGGIGGEVYEAYEVKNIREKLRCLLPEKEKYFFYIHDVITWEK